MNRPVHHKLPLGTIATANILEGKYVAFRNHVGVTGQHAGETFIRGRDAVGCTHKNDGHRLFGVFGCVDFGVQLVAVARAIIAKPTLLLADEPTGNLHSDHGRQIMELFKKLNSEGTTIIQVTHSETNASYGSRVVNLRDGWVVDE